MSKNSGADDDTVALIAVVCDGTRYWGTTPEAYFVESGHRRARGQRAAVGQAVGGGGRGVVDGDRERLGHRGSRHSVEEVDDQRPRPRGRIGRVQLGADLRLGRGASGGRGGEQ